MERRECRFYRTPKGCFAGSKCIYAHSEQSHSANQTQPEIQKSTATQTTLSWADRLAGKVLQPNEQTSQVPKTQPQTACPPTPDTQKESTPINSHPKPSPQQSKEQLKPAKSQQS